MPWGKVDDRFYDHRKVEGLRGSLEGLAAIGLWTLALSWCNRQLTDGAIDDRRPRRLAEVDEADRLAAMLVEAGLWEASSEGFQVHDYLAFNDSAEEILERRAQEAARMRELRERNRAARTGERTGARTPARTDVRTPERTGERTDVRTDPPARAPARPRPGLARPRPGVSRPGPAQPGPSSTETVQGSSQPSRARAGEAAAGTRSTTNDGGDPWASFAAKAWGPFRKAWQGRGLALPPAGSEFDEDEEHPSQRALLWTIAEARPRDLARWVTEAPGRTAFEVVAHVLSAWQAERARVEAIAEAPGRNGDVERAEAAAIVRGIESFASDLEA